MHINVAASWMYAECISLECHMTWTWSHNKISIFQKIPGHVKFYYHYYYYHSGNLITKLRAPNFMPFADTHEINTHFCCRSSISLTFCLKFTELIKRTPLKRLNAKMRFIFLWWCCVCAWVFDFWWQSNEISFHLQRMLVNSREDIYCSTNYSRK